MSFQLGVHQERTTARFANELAIFAVNGPTVLLHLFGQPKHDRTLGALDLLVAMPNHVALQANHVLEHFAAFGTLDLVVLVNASLVHGQTGFAVKRFVALVASDEVVQRTIVRVAMSLVVLSLGVCENK